MKLFSNDTAVDGILLRPLAPNHERMGQSIDYARMIGPDPPSVAMPS